MGSSNNCKQLRSCQEKDNPSYLHSIKINGIVESLDCIPIEKSNVSLKDTEFEQRLKQSVKTDHINNQQPSIKVLDSLIVVQQVGTQIEPYVNLCKKCSKEFDQTMISLSCQDSFHTHCLIELFNNQIDNNNSILRCLCSEKIHTKILRQYVPVNKIDKFFSNQLGTLQLQNQSVLCFQKKADDQKEQCIYCQKIIISQGIQLKCKHGMHKHCIKKLCSEQVEKDKTYLMCPCGAAIHTSIIRSFKSDSFKPILSRLFKNQLIELYNSNNTMQNKFSFKIYIKAVNFYEDQKKSTCSLP